MLLNCLADSVQVAHVENLTEENINGHHEYRGSALPAWGVMMPPGSSHRLCAC